MKTCRLKQIVFKIIAHRDDKLSMARTCGVLGNIVTFSNTLHYITEKKAEGIESGFALWLIGAITEQQNGGSFQGDELS